MRIRVFFTAGSAEGAVPRDGVCVVVDVIRATTTMVEALANGAASIYPVVSTEEAIRLASSLGREDTLLIGERKGLKIEGFDLGNSPREFTGERIAGKRLVMSTTNGTRAFAAAAGAERVVAGSFLNLSAVARSVAGAERLIVVCAGKENHFSLDDAVCAGHLLRKVLEKGEAAELNDAAVAALRVAEGIEPTAEFLASTAAGKALEEVGLEEDLPFCARLDLHDVVPEMEDRVVRIP